MHQKKERLDEIEKALAGYTLDPTQEILRINFTFSVNIRSGNDMQICS